MRTTPITHPLTSHNDNDNNSPSMMISILNCCVSLTHKPVLSLDHMPSGSAIGWIYIIKYLYNVDNTFTGCHWWPTSYLFGISLDNLTSGTPTTTALYLHSSSVYSYIILMTQERCEYADRGRRTVNRILND